MNLRTDLFFLLIDTCYHHGHFKMTSRIYETMLRFECVSDNRIKLRYFEHQKKENRNKNKAEKKVKKVA